MVDYSPQDVPFRASDDAPRPSMEAPGNVDCNVPDHVMSEIRTLRVRISELDALRQAARERDAMLDRARRAQADFANYQKVLDEERALALEATLAEIARELIPVLDALDALLIRAAVDRDYEAVCRQIREPVDGVFRVLAGKGLRAIAPNGGEFDPAYHEAVGVVSTAEHPPGSVVHVERKGYQLHGRLLRPALVRVARVPEGGWAGTARDPGCHTMSEQPTHESDRRNGAGESRDSRRG